MCRISSKCIKKANGYALKQRNVYNFRKMRRKIKKTWLKNIEVLRKQVHTHQDKEMFRCSRLQMKHSKTKKCVGKQSNSVEYY